MPTTLTVLAFAVRSLSPLLRWPALVHLWVLWFQKGWYSVVWIVGLAPLGPSMVRSTKSWSRLSYKAMTGSAFVWPVVASVARTLSPSLMLPMAVVEPLARRTAVAGVKLFLQPPPPPP